MLAKALTARKINAPSAKVWDTVSRIGRLDVWFPSISACSVEGTGVGAIRSLTFVDGTKATDRVEQVDHEHRRVVYNRFASPFPVSSYIGTVEVLESFDGLAVVVWTVDLELEQGVRDAVVTRLEQGIGNALIGMQTDLANGV